MVLLDLINHQDGLLFLRMVGPEPAVNAIWARLVSREYRGDIITSKVEARWQNGGHTEGVAAQKGTRYKTLRSKLPCGEVDLVVIHPALTPAYDRPARILLISYQTGLPSTFFDRLRAVLPWPIQADWAPWLWTEGQTEQTFQITDRRTIRRDGQEIDQPYLTRAVETPIRPVTTMGDIRCYEITAEGHSLTAWLQIVRQQLGLGTPLAWIPGGKNGHHLRSAEGWLCLETSDGWELHRQDERYLTGPSLDYLIVAARETLGLNFLVPERGHPCLA